MLAAVAGIGSQLEPPAALRAIVAAAVDLTAARYGALGLAGEDGTLSGFIPAGMSPAQIAGIGHWPQGRGLLGELICHPGPLRLHDLAAHPSSAGFPAGHPPIRMPGAPEKGLLPGALAPCCCRARAAARADRLADGPDRRQDGDIRVRAARPAATGAAPGPAGPARPGPRRSGRPRERERLRGL